MELSMLTRTKQLLESAGLPISLRDNQYAETDLGVKSYNEKVRALTPQVFLEYMSMDKKVADGQLSLVLLETCSRSGKGLDSKALVTDKFESKYLEAVVSKYCDSR